MQAHFPKIILLPYSAKKYIQHSSIKPVTQSRYLFICTLTRIARSKIDAKSFCGFLINRLFSDYLGQEEIVCTQETLGSF